MAFSKEDWTRTTLANLNVLPGNDVTRLYETSTALLAILHHALQKSSESMLPSYTISLPKASTAGSAIALDLGGSMLRVAVIDYLSHAERQAGGADVTKHSRKVLVRNSWSVGDDIKALQAKDFFDWIAGCVRETLAEAGFGLGQGKSVGVTWSFPVEHTSPASGRVIQMGKGYALWQEIAGTDLQSHFEAAFVRQGLQLYMNALVNDTEATLLSHAFANPSTGISLILGTGLNAALRLPVSSFAAWKVDSRPKGWLERAAAVLVNTEISMFGAGVFPMTKADVALDAASSAPGFQPLEQMTSGKYLGEVVRLTLEQGVQDGFLFGGTMPAGMRTRFGFDTSNMAILEIGSVEDGIHLVWKAFYCQHAPTREDVKIIQSICCAISERAAVYIAVMLFTIWRLQRDTMLADIRTSPLIPTQSSPVAIAYCGAVIEKHPTLRRRIQEVLDLLVKHEVANHGPAPARLFLEEAEDSGLLGAGVASVMNVLDEDDIMRIDWKGQQFSIDIPSIPSAPHMSAVAASSQAAPSS